ncbi:lysophospholipid acyltransferase family protein [Shimia sp. MMG029]|uniref:lysophospholipid acyltransferase family protein n=1 Tax=Shimia sp. MMG029 TaxID=3021978 RepID=UPI0022FE591C|nr:lysophospholipid acyltransferase family protein [Shimia sp. MMG029]MDA5558345.1 lysophospholipid acyltransferase family protein [Shimia sp. MMG029]
MRLAIQWVLSIIYVIQNAVMMLLMGILFFPWALFSPKGATAACRTYATWAIWTARWLVGIRSEVRGLVPSGAVLIPAKHQSFLDIMMIFKVLPQPRFIMKYELLFTPIIGVYAWRLGCVPVRRGRRGAAIKAMLADVESGRVPPGQLAIYPQGTRVPVGEYVPYKVGPYALYKETGQTAVPVATNCGMFWPKGTMLRKPGLAVVEFLAPIEQGLSQKEFMTQLEAVIEDRSNALMQEAGFDLDTVRR